MRKTRIGVALLLAVFLTLSVSISHADEVSQVRAAIVAKQAQWQAGETSMTLLSPAERRARLGLVKPSTARRRRDDGHGGAPPRGRTAESRLAKQRRELRHTREKPGGLRQLLGLRHDGGPRIVDSPGRTTRRESISTCRSRSSYPAAPRAATMREAAAAEATLPTPPTISATRDCPSRPVTPTRQPTGAAAAPAAPTRPPRIRSQAGPT